MIAIYTILDPRSEEVRYVGRTKNPNRRIREHLSDPCSEGLRRWFSELSGLGLKPIMRIIEWCQISEWMERESFWIASYRKTNTMLLNVCSSGGGPTDSDYSADVRAKMRAAQLGKRPSPETRAKMSAAGRGRKYSEEMLQKRRGKKRTEEQKQRMSKAQRGNTKKRGWKAPQSTREKLASALLGNSNAKGTIHSAETRRLIGIASKARWENRNKTTV